MATMSSSSPLELDEHVIRPLLGTLPLLTEGQAALVWGHRGVMPFENTLRGFGEALACDLDGIELDLMLSADQQIVIFHDDTLERLANSREKVAALRWDQLEQVTLRCGERIPRLVDLLATWPKEKWLNLELKSGGKPLVTALAPLLRSEIAEGRVLASRVVLSSFDPRLLEAAADLLPDITRALLLDMASPSWLHADQGRSFGVSGVHLAAQLFGENTVEKLQKAGLYAAVWGAKSPQREVDLVGRGVVCVITDFAQRHPLVQRG